MRPTAAQALAARRTAANGRQSGWSAVLPTVAADGRKAVESMLMAKRVRQRSGAVVAVHDNRPRKRSQPPGGGTDPADPRRAIGMSKTGSAAPIYSFGGIAS